MTVVKNKMSARGNMHLMTRLEVAHHGVPQGTIVMKIVAGVIAKKN